MSKNPKDRPRSAEEVRLVLENTEVIAAEIEPVDELSVLDRIVRGRLVGREKEIAESRRIWRQAQAGEGQLLLISGEPGVGKSRLMREIVTKAEIGNGQAFIGEIQAEGNAPYVAFAQIIRRALSAYPNNGLEISRLVMAELIHIAPELQFDYPDIVPNPSLEPDSERRRLFESMIRFITSLSEKKPLLLVLEDIHWADSGTLALLQFLAQRTREFPVMLLGTYREVELGEALPFYETLLDLNRRSIGKRLRLERLDQTKTQELLSVLFADEITPEFLDGIYNETEGNPFFIEEVCKALVESGDLYFVDGEWHRPDMTDMTIPQSIRVAVQSRLNKLSRDLQEILLNAAVIGREFDFEILLQICGKEEDILIDGLEEAIKAQLIEEREDGIVECFWFLHALIPAALRESLSGLRRTRLHRKVAQAIERIQPEAYQRLAYHWGEGGDEEKGLAYMIKAANQARQAYASEDAIRLYSEALALLPEESEARFDLLAERASLNAVIANQTAYLDDCEALLVLADALDDDTFRCKALLALGEYYLQIENEKSFELLSRALEIAQIIGDTVSKAQALGLIGNIYLDTEDYFESLKALETASELFLETGHLRQTVLSLDRIALAYSFLGDQTAAVEAAKRSLEISRKVGDPQLELIALNRMGSAYSQQKDFSMAQKAQPFLEKSLDMARKIGDRQYEYYLLNNLAINYYFLKQMEKSKNCLLQAFQITDETGQAIRNHYSAYFEIFVRFAGEYEGGLRLMQTGLERAKRDGNISLIVFNLLEIQKGLYDLGRYQQVIELLDEYAAEIEIVRGPSGRWSALSRKGLCHFFLGENETGFQMMVAACEQLKSNPPSRPYSRALTGLALAKSYLEDCAELSDGLEIANRSVSPFFEYWQGSKASYFRITARLQLKLGQVEAALDTSSEMIQILENEVTELRAELFYWTHAQVLRAAGQGQESDSFLYKAYDILMQVAEKIEDDDLRRSFLENVWENREILGEAKAQGIAP
jgi:predicted ATPase